jgi:hypothetical protein
MKNEIVNKINKVLSSPASDAVIDEAKVVYALVETRKLLEYDNSGNFGIVKFYCDWAVHTEKDKITTLMKDIIKKMYVSAEAQIKNPNNLSVRTETNSFAYLEALKSELKQLYQDNSINTDFISDDRKWIKFISAFIKVLENQPINNPIPEVRRIIFLPANDRCVIYRIEFIAQINGFPHYDYMNAY